MPINQFLYNNVLWSLNKNNNLGGGLVLFLSLEIKVKLLKSGNSVSRPSTRKQTPEAEGGCKLHTVQYNQVLPTLATHWFDKTL